MPWTKLLFHDEGRITRRQWWAGSSLLVMLHMATEYCAGRYLMQTGFERPVILFMTLAILVPFYSVNVKRFRAIGRSPSQAIVGGILPGLAVLSDVFLQLPAVDTLIGLGVLVVLIWYIIDLGVLDHQPAIDVEGSRV